MSSCTSKARKRVSKIFDHQTTNHPEWLATQGQRYKLSPHLRAAPPWKGTDMKIVRLDNPRRIASEEEIEAFIVDVQSAQFPKVFKLRHLTDGPCPTALNAPGTGATGSCEKEQKAFDCEKVKTLPRPPTPPSTKAESSAAAVTARQSPESARRTEGSGGMFLNDLLQSSSMHLIMAGADSDTDGHWSTSRLAIAPPDPDTDTDTDPDSPTIANHFVATPPGRKNIAKYPGTRRTSTMATTKPAIRTHEQHLWIGTETIGLTKTTKQETGSGNQGPSSDPRDHSLQSCCCVVCPDCARKQLETWHCERSGATENLTGQSAPKTTAQTDAEIRPVKLERRSKMDQSANRAGPPVSQPNTVSAPLQASAPIQHHGQQGLQTAGKRLPPPNAEASKNPVKAAFRLGTSHFPWHANDSTSSTVLGQGGQGERVRLSRPTQALLLQIPGRHRQRHVRDRLQGSRCGHG